MTTPQDILARFDDDALVTAATMRLLDLVSFDPPYTHLLNELARRRGANINAFDPSEADIRTISEVQLDILAKFGGVCGRVAAGERPDTEGLWDGMGPDDLL